MIWTDKLQKEYPNISKEMKELFFKGWEMGFDFASKEAQREIAKNYTPNNTKQPIPCSACGKYSCNNQCF